MFTLQIMMETIACGPPPTRQHVNSFSHTTEKLQMQQMNNSCFYRRKKVSDPSLLSCDRVHCFTPQIPTGDKLLREYETITTTSCLFNNITLSENDSALSSKESSYSELRDDIMAQPTIIVELLKACTKQKDLSAGLRLHSHIVKNGLLDRDVYIGSSLINMYVKCGEICKAEDVFDQLLVKDVVSWSALIAGYSQQGYGEEALVLFERMKSEGLSPNGVTFVSILKACGNLSEVEKGREVHIEVTKYGRFETNILVGNSLMDMYAKCDAFLEAEHVFNNLPNRDVVSWNVIIAGYAQCEHGKKALDSFGMMQQEHLIPDAVTFVSVLKACGSIGEISKGQEIHDVILKKGLLEHNVILGNALLDMYVKCCHLSDAQKLFDKLPMRNLVSWNTLLSGCAELGHGEEALNSFQCMQLEGFCPNEVTFVSILLACRNMKAVDEGKTIHAKIIEEGLLQNQRIGTSLLDMYVASCALEEAQIVFQQLIVQDTVLWSVLISGLVENGRDEEALKCFKQLECEAALANAAIFLCTLKACGNLGAAQRGQQLHSQICKRGFFEKNHFVGTALVEMYAKCGQLDEAQEIFAMLPTRTAVSWTSLITGYALLGKDELVFESFDKMIADGITPDLLTLTAILNACNHSGLLEKGLSYFDTMMKEFDIVPNLQHQTCLIDLFGRAGHFKEDPSIIKEKLDPDVVLWHSMMSKCSNLGDVELGRSVFKHAMELCKNDAASYVSMSNILCS